jgi:hypothetical protein
VEIGVRLGPEWENSPNSPDSPHSPSDSVHVSINSPHENSIASIAYHSRGEFGEFCPAVGESLGKKSSQVVGTPLLVPAALPLGAINTSTVEPRLEPWKQVHLMCRDDRQHGYVVGFRAAALDTFSTRASGL